MLEVEDWTQPATTSKRRSNTKKTLQSPNLSEPPSATESTPEPTPGPPDPDAEIVEPFPSRSSSSNQFSLRSRGNSAATAGPSSLSRLLAQAPPEHSVETIVPSRVQSPPPMSSAAYSPPSPSHTASTPRSAAVPLPLRSGSRASRISSSSRFSKGGIPFAGAAKAVATTALADQTVPGSSAPTMIAESLSSDSSSGISPEGSPTDGLSNLLPHHRRRVSSYHPTRQSQSPMTSPLALPSSPTATGVSSNGLDSAPAAAYTARTRLASLASSWSVPFGRRKVNDAPGPPAGSSDTSTS